MKELTQNIKEKNEDFYIIGGLLQGETDTNLEVLGEIDHIDAVENNQLYETFTEVFQEVDHLPKNIYDTWEETETVNSALYIDNVKAARFYNTAATHDRTSTTA